MSRSLDSRYAWRTRIWPRTAMPATARSAAMSASENATGRDESRSCSVCSRAEMHGLDRVPGSARFAAEVPGGRVIAEAHQDVAVGAGDRAGFAYERRRQLDRGDVHARRGRNLTGRQPDTDDPHGLCACAMWPGWPGSRLRRTGARAASLPARARADPRCPWRSRPRRRPSGRLGDRRRCATR